MVRDLHVGLILALTIRGLAVTRYDEMRRAAALAEELGFDSIWLCDHFLTLAPAAYVEDAGIARLDAGAGRATDPGSMPLLECWTAPSTARCATRRRCSGRTRRSGSAARATGCIAWPPVRRTAS